MRRIRTTQTGQTPTRHIRSISDGLPQTRSQISPPRTTQASARGLERSRKPNPTQPPPNCETNLPTLQTKKLQHSHPSLSPGARSRNFQRTSEARFRMSNPAIRSPEILNRIFPGNVGIKSAPYEAPPPDHPSVACGWASQRHHLSQRPRAHRTEPPRYYAYFS